jgi:EAL domain-containing protein (putative c-di-GMP-specific phosphodiesterase class I)
MRTATEADLAKGLRNREFVLHYQPKFSLVTNDIVGAEALARWRLPNGTMLPPSAFIPLAERTGAIQELTLQLLARLVHDLRSGGLDENLCVSLNVTAQDFEDNTLTNALLDAIANGVGRPGSLELEITETQALSGGARIREQLQVLTDAGVGLAMDDYGIGYSNMDTLSQWPFTTIKLDQGMIGRMLTSSKDATIVRASIRLGHELGVNVVAEGVEALAQQHFLAEAGCRLVQGYLVSTPLPLDEFRRFRHHSRRRHGMSPGLAHMALIDHVQWRRQMVRYVIRAASLPALHPARQLNGHPVLCENSCAFGRWYVDAGDSAVGTASYRALAGPHADLHRLGKQVAHAVRSGAALEEITPVLSELKMVSNELVRLLEDIEDDGLHALYATDTAHACLPEQERGDNKKKKGLHAFAHNPLI